MTISTHYIYLIFRKVCRIKMKFKRMLKRKVYPTWVSTQRYKGCKAYVFYFPDLNYYHYQIDCDKDVYYISLTEVVKFNDFEDCCNAAEKWIKINVNNYHK